MLDIALDINKHDILIYENDILFIDNAERIAQQIQIQLKTFLGEWFLDTTHGVPYLENILIKNPDGGLITAILTEQIKKVQDVISVELELYYNAQRRVLIVVYSANTNYGILTRKEVLGYGITE